MNEILIHILEDAGIIGLGEGVTAQEAILADRILKRRIAEAERLAIEDLRQTFGLKPKTLRLEDFMHS